MHTVGLPGQHGPRPRHIKGPARAESRGTAGLPAGLPRARRVPPLPAAVAVAVAQIVFLPARPSPREHRFDDQIKDLFLAEVARAVIIRAGTAASSEGTVTAGAAASSGGTVTARAAASSGGTVTARAAASSEGTATAGAGPAAAAATRRAAVPGTPGR